jgi:hypothetical protein
MPVPVLADLVLPPTRLDSQRVQRLVLDLVVILSVAPAHSRLDPLNRRVPHQPPTRTRQGASTAGRLGRPRRGSRSAGGCLLAPLPADGLPTLVCGWPNIGRPQTETDIILPDLAVHATQALALWTSPRMLKRRRPAPEGQVLVGPPTRRRTVETSLVRQRAPDLQAPPSRSAGLPSPLRQKTGVDTES